MELADQLRLCRPKVVNIFALKTVRRRGEAPGDAFDCEDDEKPI
jgi:hypothetical protein